MILHIVYWSRCLGPFSIGCGARGTFERVVQGQFSRVCLAGNKNGAPRFKSGPNGVLRLFARPSKHFVEVTAGLCAALAALPRCLMHYLPINT